MKQTIIATSSTEAELIAVYNAIPEVRLLIGLFYDLDLQYNIILNQDNMSAISLINTGRSNTNRSRRNMTVKINKVNEFVMEHHIIIQYMPTETMLADLLTKVHPKWRFNKLVPYFLSTGHQELITN